MRQRIVRCIRQWEPAVLRLVGVIGLSVPLVACAGAQDLGGLAVFEGERFGRVLSGDVERMALLMAVAHFVILFILTLPVAALLIDYQWLFAL